MKKFIKTFESFEEPRSIVAWYTSFGPVESFKPVPSWFTTDREFAEAYHQNSLDKGADVLTYEVEVRGDIRSESSARRLAEELGVDFESLVTDLTSNPTQSERLELVEPFIDQCDGFFHWDYDPRDWGDGESLLVFDPSRHVRIVRDASGDFR
jgi:hypothetical protein